MTAKLSYQYVVLRCVPRVEREEFLNVGVVLYCQATDYLDVAWQVDRERLLRVAREHLLAARDVKRVMQRTAVHRDATVRAGFCNIGEQGVRVRRCPDTWPPKRRRDHEAKRGDAPYQW